MKKRKSDNRLRISSFCMHRRPTIPKRQKQNNKETTTTMVMEGLSGGEIQHEKWFGGFDLCFRAIFVLCCIISFHMLPFSLLHFFVSHTRQKLLIVDALLMRFTFGLLRTGFCKILNFKLEMELSRKKNEARLGFRRD